MAISGRLLTYKDPIPGAGSADNPQTLSPSWIKVDEKRSVIRSEYLSANVTI
jgi:hypothetical protein